MRAVPEFKRPDFTALEILAFATGGIPAGIVRQASQAVQGEATLITDLAEHPQLCLPHPQAPRQQLTDLPMFADHDVREVDGFKNVSLRASTPKPSAESLSLTLLARKENILSAKAANEVTTFIAPEEVKEYKAWEDKAFEVQVASHGASCCPCKSSRPQNLADLSLCALRQSSSATARASSSRSRRTARATLTRRRRSTRSRASPSRLGTGRASRTGPASVPSRPPVRRQSCLRPSRQKSLT